MLRHSVIESKISPKLVKNAHLCSNTRFSGLEWSFSKIQKPRTIRMKCSCHGTGTQDSGTSWRQATAWQSWLPSQDFHQFCSIDYISGLKWNFLEIQKSKIISLEYLIILRMTWGYITQGRQDKGSKFARGVTYSEYLSWHVANTLTH